MYMKAVVFSMALVFAATCIANPTNKSAEDKQAVERASAQFYEGLNALFTGDASPMDRVWSHADDVTYMGPAGGIQVGWPQVRAEWETQAALKLGGKVEPQETHVTVGNDLAFVQCYEIGNNLDAQGQPFQVLIRATNLFRKENGQWKMIGHHTDLIPQLEQRPRTARAN